MTQIKYNQLEESLKPLQNKTLPQLYLLWGEQYLIDEKVEFIISKLLSKEERKLSFNIFSGDELSVNNILDEISTYSVFLDKKVIFAKGLTASKDELKRLSHFAETGIPENNYLILSLTKLDKRSAFFKSFISKAIGIDCSIPKGIGKKDIGEQTQFLRVETSRILKNNQKEIDENAFLKLIDLTGFKPDIFIDNLEKLVSFTGNKKSITIADVSQLVKRTKIDPIFDFTNAFSDKNVKKSIFFLSSLLNSDFHVLQILKALTNHTRKIFAVKCFVHTLNKNQNRTWIKGMDFNSFNNNVIPKIKDADKALLKELKSYKEDNSDFFLASKSKSTYPLYQTFKKSDNYSLTELENILIEIAGLDNKFKSSSQDPQILIKDFIFRFCI
jgi:DNA polymerase III subunit delta